MVPALNDDGSRVFVIVADLPPGETKDSLSWRMYGDVYDTKTARRTSRTRLTSILGKEMLVFSDASNNRVRTRRNWRNANTTASNCGLETLRRRKRRVL
jgi:hypothetical protein